LPIVSPIPDFGDFRIERVWFLRLSSRTGRSSDAGDGGARRPLSLAGCLADHDARISAAKEEVFSASSKQQQSLARHRFRTNFSLAASTLDDLRRRLPLPIQSHPERTIRQPIDQPDELQHVKLLASMSA